MELRVLKYFLTVAKEQSITGASEALHLSQPTLSRQLRELEDEVGKPLFIRGARKVTLTDEGMILRKRAEEILTLVEKTTNEISATNEHVAGDIYIGAAETVGTRFLTSTAEEMREIFPEVRFHFVSGDRDDVRDSLDKGILDFLLLFGPVDETKYNSIEVPYHDKWGVLMRKESHLAAKKVIRPEDLAGEPLMATRQAIQDGRLDNWFGRKIDSDNFVATINLIYNGTLMVTDGLGYLITIDRLLNIVGESVLTYRPLDPPLYEVSHIIWKKYSVFTRAAEKFLELLQENAAHPDPSLFATRDVSP